jgi:hypothetical protein
VQVVGSTSEIILFFAGYFLGKDMLAITAMLLLLRIANKIIISELMFKRQIAVIRENVGGAKK